MTLISTRTSRTLAWGFLAACGGAVGCSTLTSPLPPDANIRRPIAPPQLPPPPIPTKLPDPPAARPEGAPEPPAPTRDDAPLALAEVLGSVQTHFPLLYAVEQERGIAGGQRLAAEGQFDLLLRARGADQGGTFSNGRLDVGVEQPTPFGGATTYAGWRLGQGNFPVYYGDRKTADGGEFRAGVTLPLLQNRDIDPRRARLRAAQITEQLADPQVRRARLDYFRNAAQAYWSWVSAGSQYQVAEEVLKLALDRQALIDEQRRQQLVPETVQVLNRRLAAGREEQLLAADRAVQQAAVRLSLFLRDANGNPITPPSGWLPARFVDVVPPPPNAAHLKDDVEAALSRRPELVRFALQKQRSAVDLKLADNQLYPAVNVFAAVAQDAGLAKKTFTGEGPFATDRTNAEVGLWFEMPLQRRDALGRAATARSQMAQLLAQERFARDEITAQVQDAVSELDRTYLRVEKARVELREAVRVRNLEAESFRAGRTSLVDLNLQEVAAAEAQVKVVAILAMYFRGVAEYLAALGTDPVDPARARGCVLPQTEPLGVVQPKKP